MCTIEKAVAFDMTQNTVLTASHGSFTGLRMKIKELICTKYNSHFLSF